MFGQTGSATLPTNQHSALNQGLMGQQMHPFQAHIPSSGYNGQAALPYQSIKKTIPTMSQGNGTELTNFNNNYGSFSNNGMNGQMPTQPGAFTHAPNQSLPPQAQQQLLPPTADPHDIVPSDGALLYFNEINVLSSEKVPSAVKLEGESYTCLLVLNLVFLITVVGAFVVLNVLKLEVWMLGPMIGVSYIVYLIVGLITNNSMSAFFNNLRDSEEIERSFQLVRQSKGDMTFIAKCYHRPPGRPLGRVNTHTAKASFPLAECIDESEDFQKIKQEHAFLVGTASTCFYFGDINSQTKFLNAFREFRAANRFDKHQSYIHGVSIVTPNMGLPFTISLRGSACYVKPLYYLFFFLGLGYPYTMFIECRIGRYKLNCVKRLTAA